MKPFGQPVTEIFDFEEGSRFAALTVIAFLKCVFKNTYQKDICTSIVFKAESKPKHEEFFFEFFFKKHFFGGGPK